MEFLFIGGLIALAAWFYSRPRRSPPATHAPRPASAVEPPRSTLPPAFTTSAARGLVSSAEPKDLTEEFRRAIEFINRGEGNLFVTGRAGTGKSTLLRHVAAAHNGDIAIVAPTGLAALNVGGQTIHSFFKFPPRLLRPEEVRVGRNVSLLRRLKTLIVDEVSMVRSDMMASIDRKLQMARGADQPFGGVNVVMFGDLHQLPPVVSDNAVSSYLKDHFGGPYFFDALRSQGRARRVKMIELHKKFRQRDPVFASFLDAVSENRATIEQVAALNELVVPLDQLANADQFTILAPHNATVNDINRGFLEKLDGPEFVSSAEIIGKFDERNAPTDMSLRLREGARVVILRNDPNRRWVNGSIAIVARISESRVWITLGGALHELERASWEKIEYEYDPIERRIVQKVVGTFKQLPLRLAWALTIHKSQGMTLDRVFIDLDRGAFAHGQTYVALSRCTSMDGLRLGRPLQMNDIVFDPSALGYRDVFESIH